MPYPAPLLEQAFAPAIPNVTHIPEKLAALYDEAPYYEGPASVLEPNAEIKAENPPFTVEEAEQLCKFNRQFDILIEVIRDSNNKFLFTLKQINYLNIFWKRITNRSFEKQTSLYYSTIKIHFENIVIAILNDDPKVIKYQQPIMHDLINELYSCGSGVSGHIANAAMLLMSENTIENWLANYRNIIIRQISEKHVTKKKIIANHSLHVYNVFYQHACKQGWNPIGFQSYESVNENHANLTAVDDEDLRQFEKDFFVEYNPATIITFIAESLYANYSIRLQTGLKANSAGVNIVDQLGFLEFFEGIPLIEKDGIIDVLFKLHESADGLTPEMSFTYANYRYILKNNMAELKLYVTQYYLKLHTARLFEGYAQPINQDFSFGIVPAWSELCYLYSIEDDTIQLLNQTAPPIELSIFVDEKIPLTPTSFGSYVAAGILDFSECILQDVDLTSLNNFNEFYFERTLFKHVKITAPQFLRLFLNGHGDINSSLQLVVDKALYPDIFQTVGSDLRVQNEPIDLNKLLYFAAATLDDYDFIENLIKLGADPKFEYNNLTPVEQALLAEHWRTIEAIARNTTPENNQKDACRFGSAMVTASQQNINELIKWLVLANASGNWRVIDSFNTSLHWAAINNNISILEDLVKSSIYIGALNKQKKSEIALALSNNFWDFILKLISLKSDKDDQFQYGLALFTAVSNKMADHIVKKLIAANAECGWSINGFSTLHNAFLHDEAEWVELIVKHGADLKDADLNRSTALQFAIKNVRWNCIKSYAKAVKKYRQKEDVNDLGEALVAALKHKEFSLAATLIYTGARTDYWTEPDLNTSYHWAIEHGDTNSLRLLLKSPVDLTKTNLAGRTPYQHAVALNATSCIEILDAFVISTTVLTALKNKNYDRAEALLIEHKEKSTIVTFANFSDGNTCLHLAMRSNRPTLVQLIVEMGADVDAVNNVGLTAIQHAVDSEYFDTLLVLATKIPDSNNGTTRFGAGLVNMYFLEKYDLFDQFLALGISKNVKQEYLRGESFYKSSCLHFAYTRKRYDDMQRLLLLGADFSICNELNKTVLQLALEFNPNWTAINILADYFSRSPANYSQELGAILLVVVRENKTNLALSLIANGACVACTTENDSNTPLHWAMLRRNTTLIAPLISAGANVNAVNSDNLSPLDVARQSDQSPHSGKWCGFFSRLFPVIKLTEVYAEALSKYASRQNQVVNQI